MSSSSRSQPSEQFAEEEFTNQLYRGGELLSTGKVAEAREYLERAYKLQPNNPKCQNLLGLAYFKLNLYELAAEIYEVLVADNPEDPTLRVNLGLVYLKHGELTRAVREFAAAVDLSPTHQKAHNYLGLAHAQAGEYAKARDHFIKAGSEHMAEKMARALAERANAKAASAAEVQHAEVSLDEEEPPPQAVSAAEDLVRTDPPKMVEALAPPLGGNWGEMFQTDKVPPAEEPTAPPAPVEVTYFAKTEVPAEPPQADTEPEMEAVPDAEEIQTSPSEEIPTPEPTPESEEFLIEETSMEEVAMEAEAATPPPVEAPQAQVIPHPAVSVTQLLTAQTGNSSLAELAQSVPLVSEALVGPFQLGAETCALVVNGTLWGRLEGWVAMAGEVTAEPEFKHYRGSPTDKAFGAGSRHMQRLSGRGVVFLEQRARQFEAVVLGEESGFFREEAVFGFEGSVRFENGRLTGEKGETLDLVNLTGPGQALLQLNGALRSLEIHTDRPVVVPVERLMGWLGSVTPRLLMQGGVAVELTGEGFALFAVPPPSSR